ncbi:hypothetical protein AAG906_030839 [Vitis piasezkii]
MAMSFDQHSSTRVLDMMRDMSFLPSFGLGRRQHGSNEVRDQLFSITLDYPIRSYTFNLADFFVRGSEVQPHVEEICVEDVIEPGDMVDEVVPHDEYRDKMVFIAFCDNLSLLVPYSPISRIFDIDDEISQHDSYERATILVGNPRELKIGSPLSIDERNNLIHLLRSYLDVFACHMRTCRSQSSIV